MSDTWREEELLVPLLLKVFFNPNMLEESFLPVLVCVSAVVTGKVLGQVQTGSVIQYIPADQLGADHWVHL